MSNRIKSDDIQIGNNYVLPIEQSNVTVQQAKVKKIIEETEGKAQLIIDNAENKSSIIVETANTEAQRIIEDAQRKAQNEYEAIRQQAYNEGFEQGQADGSVFDMEILHKITLDAIRELNDKENITIIVNPQLVDNISTLSEKFREEISNLQSIKIIEDSSVSPDGVIVETLNTRLDSRVSTQIQEIAQKMLTGANDELE